MRRREKCTEDVRLWLGSTLKSDLKVAAAKAGHESLSPFIRKILSDWMYGHGNDRRDLWAESIKDE